MSRARISQIMNLTLLAPDIQEAIAFLASTSVPRTSVGERDIRPLCAILDWRKQQRMWGEMVGCRDGGQTDAVQ